MEKISINKNRSIQLLIKSISVSLFLIILFLVSSGWIFGNDKYETERLRAKGKWIYALGAVPERCVGLYHVGLGFTLCIGDEDQNLAYVVGVEIDYSGGRGEKMEKLEERGADGWQIIQKSKGSFYFINLGIIFGVYYQRQKTSWYISIGNSFWQSKLKNWGNFPTFLGIGFKWYPSKRISIRIAELRLYFIDQPSPNTRYIYYYDSGSLDFEGLGMTCSCGIELRW